MTITELKVRLFGDPVLRKKAAAVKEIGQAELMLAQSMVATMHREKGIGLAAPQVGISKRLFVVDVGEGPLIIFNPRVVKKQGSAEMEEGCLSIPGVNVKVKRPTEILVRYTDHKGKVVEKHFQDLLARVFLHENDHLNGKMIVDYASFSEKAKLKKQLKEIKDFQKQQDT